jgi:hypothetical protein
MSSLLFSGNANSYLRIPNTVTDDFDLGTGNFTIEWYQYQTDTNTQPAIFSIGNYYISDYRWYIAAFMAGSNFNYSNFYNSRSSRLYRTDYINKWVHFAISRYNGTTKIFMNGSSIISFTDNTDYIQIFGGDLTIANQNTPYQDTAFGGYITYFTWVKGVALYTANFTVSNTYPTITNNYILYLKADNFAGSLGNTVINNNVSTIQMVPPNFVSNSDTSDTNTSQVQNRISLTSLFTNNAQVYYKPGSLASCVVGTVRNSSSKVRRI